mmetsp:Transcript_5031/g.9465  ORF Transcript_5031/g.9465 Transcript_5031/m.9465 type:complete len:438 (-) Transcript_5031:89-1402(-)
MSVVTVQLGQCGNQIGAEFFRTAYEEASASHLTYETFFRAPEHDKGQGQLVARAVLIDTEPKVIQAVTRGEGSGAHGWKYEPGNCLWQQSGSGNNWARGYHQYGPQLHDQVCDVIHREVEACDHLGGFVLMQSMAGGTGAGLGTRVAEVLREEFPSTCIMSQCVWPYDSGEVIVQNYNTLLTLSHLLDATDGIILVPNEGLHATCARLHNIKRPDFQDLNRVAARALASVLLPAASGSGNQPGSGKCMSVSDVAEHMCAHPAHRVLGLRCVPQMPAGSVDFTVFTWASILKRLRQMLITGSILEEGFNWGTSVPAPGATPKTRIVKSIANVLVLRGKGSMGADTSGFQDPGLYPIWAVSPLKVASQTAQFGKYEKAAGLLSNCQTFMPATERMLSHAYGMYESRAYIHQYTQQGMVQADFEEAFAQVEDCLAHYRSI